MSYKSARSKGVMAALVTMTVVVALGSAAFACTTFKGTFSLTQSGVTKTNTGNNSGMGFCSGSTVQTMNLVGATSFTVAVASSTGTCASQLGKKTFAIKHSSLALVSDCMNGTAFTETLVVPLSGSASKVVAGGQIGVADDTVCVADSTKSTGNGMSVVVS